MACGAILLSREILESTNIINQETGKFIDFLQSALEAETPVESLLQPTGSEEICQHCFHDRKKTQTCFCFVANDCTSIAVDGNSLFCSLEWIDGKRS